MNSKSVCERWPASGGRLFAVKRLRSMFTKIATDRRMNNIESKLLGSVE